MDSYQRRFLYKASLRSQAVFVPIFLTIVSFAVGAAPFVFSFDPDLSNTQFSDMALMLSLVPYICFLFAFLALAAALANLYFHALPVLLSYLEVSEGGLEYRFWHGYHIRCSWGDLQQIVRRQEAFVICSILILSQAEELGPPVSMKLREKLGLDTQYFIPLSVLEGWPQGELEDLLQERVPHLLDEEQDVA